MDKSTSYVKKCFVGRVDFTVHLVACSLANPVCDVLSW